MKVLVTGGTGVVGQATVNALLRHGHQVRVLSRHAAEDAGQWADGVEPFPGNVADAGSVHGAGAGCQAIIHAAGIVAESPPERTFANVNVEGTRNILREANRTGIRQIVYISSLGADRGASAYHRSKLRAEELVAGFAGSWTILRPGNVYGPGDEVISLLLRMVRTMPVIPVVGAGDHPFQPIWHEDLAEAIAQCVAREDLSARVLELAGTELTTVNEILDAFDALTGKSPVRVPIPEFIARMALGAADSLGADLPVNSDQLTMLLEENVIDSPGDNALTGVFSIEPTALRDGLAALADAQPEQTPEEGVGDLERRVFWIDVENPRLDADALFVRFRSAFNDFVPIEAAAEPGTADVLTEGATLTLALPARGNIQVRVEEVRPDCVWLATLAGHPLAGAVSFRIEPRPDGYRFLVEVIDRPASRLDQVAMALGGSVLQSRTWQDVCERVLEVSGGGSRAGVQHEDLPMNGAQAEAAESRLVSLIHKRKQRQENASQRTAESP